MPPRSSPKLVQIDLFDPAIVAAIIAESAPPPAPAPEPWTFERVLRLLPPADGELLVLAIGARQRRRHSASEIAWLLDRPERAVRASWARVVRDLAGQIGDGPWAEDDSDAGRLRQILAG